MAEGSDRFHAESPRVGVCDRQGSDLCGEGVHRWPARTPPLMQMFCGSKALADLQEAYKRDADRVDSAIEKMADSSNATTVQSGGSGGLSVIVDLLQDW